MTSIYDSMLNAGHTLIAGATGSGKSTVISGLIHTAIHNSPAITRFVLIDPKRVDMMEYANLPHVERYATEPDQIAEALQYAIDIMESRYKYMAQRRIKEYDGGRLIIVIDELADLLTDRTNKRIITPLIQRLAQLGRAAHITVIMATQCCLSSVISTPVKTNFASRLALRTATAQDSRNVIDQKGAEQLPDPRIAGYAQGIWRSGADTSRVDLPRFTDEERQRQIDEWCRKYTSKPRKVFSRLFGRRIA